MSRRRWRENRARVQRRVRALARALCPSAVPLVAVPHAGPRCATCGGRVPRVYQLSQRYPLRLHRTHGAECLWVLDAARGPIRFGALN